MLKSHAEVDAYAVQILGSLNFDGWSKVVSFLNDEISKLNPIDEGEKWGQLDFSNRLRMIKSLTVNEQSIK